MSVSRSKYGGGQKQTLTISFKVDDAVLAQIQCIADEREWS